jgi:signal transduction histidine kinase/AraC-like DNA-binding protein/streptogramin lyase
VEDGLSNSVVFCILQDNMGFMWFGTVNGLNKYDGYKFTVYKNIPGDSTSLIDNWISTIYEDISGHIWVGTSNAGLCRFNPQTDSFYRYVHNANDTTSLCSNKISSIFESKKNDSTILWVGTLGGVNKYNPATNKFSRYRPEENKDNLKVNVNLIKSITQDHHNKLWMATYYEGLFYYDPESDQFIRYEQNSEGSAKFRNKFVTDVHASFEQGEKSLWISTYTDGLFRINIDNGKITNYLSQSGINIGVSNKNIICIHPAKSAGKSVLWIGTYQGLYRLDMVTEKLTEYRNEIGNRTSLSSNSVLSLYEDRTGILWMGTRRGINKINPQLSNFFTMTPRSSNENSLNDNAVKALYETDLNGRRVLWIGTGASGLNRYDRDTGQFTYLKHDPEDDGSLSADNVTSIVKTSSTGGVYLWVGTVNGLNRINLETGKIKRIYISESDASYNEILTLFADQTGLIWIGAANSYVYSYNPVDETFKRYSGHRSVYSIYRDSFDYLWMGTVVGLKKLHLQSGKSIWYRNIHDDPKSISNNDILNIIEDKNEVLWIGTSGGLNKYNRKTDTFTRFTEADGLLNTVINAMLEDDTGNLWLSTDKGISKYDKQKNSFKNFISADGLQGDAFLYGSAYKNKDGELFFGGINGFTALHPNRLVENMSIPPILITDFRLFNKPIQPGMNSLLKNNISHSSEITLSYDQSVFSFEFAALDYHSPLKNKYAYQLIGIDPDWVYTDASRRFATYTNLDAGEYIFKVRGSNNDGLWNNGGTSVKVIILPPWWKTNWAYSIYVLFIGLVMFGLWRFQSNRFKMKQQLEMEHFETEKLREVDKLKSQFFANISHEFRTPLTLIKGPVKQMLEDKFVGNIKEQHKMILRNSERLLGLINQILDLSKLESGEIKLKVQKTEFVSYLKGLVLSFSSLAERKKISLNLNISDNSLLGYSDHEKLEKIVNNLLSNAFKFTPEKGIIEVTLKMTNAQAQMTNQIQNPNVKKIPIYQFPILSSQFPSPNSKSIQISISNTGTGIPVDQLDKIFDRFYQADDNYRKDNEGSGIGLALTKELVEVCRGEITVSSIASKKTIFKVSLPVDKNYFNEEEIIEKMQTGNRRSDQGNEILPDHNLEKNAGYRISDTEELAESKSLSPVSGFRPPLILIVEDNPDVTAYISSFMKNDLVISDVMMPDMDGFELCQNLKSDEITSHIPFILLTARADLESKLEGLEFGADDYITKPFDAKELLVRSRNLLEQRSRLKEHFQRQLSFQPSEITVNSMDEKFMKKAIELIEYYMDDNDFNVKKFSNEVGMSSRNLSRKLRAITNYSAQEFIRVMRLKRAAQLLLNKSDQITQIAYQVGFNNPSYFAECFKKQYGVSPSEYTVK